MHYHYLIHRNKIAGGGTYVDDSDNVISDTFYPNGFAPSTTGKYIICYNWELFKYNKGHCPRKF